jgi:hypothetical protein
MMCSRPVSFLNSEFNDFLFSPIGEGKNETLPSVLSALARLDIDPWQEACQLSLLLEESATRRLAGLIAALPDESSARRDPEMIALRLVALLPHRRKSAVTPPKLGLGERMATHFQTFLYVILMGFVLLGGAVSMMAGRPSADNVNATPTSQRIFPYKIDSDNN